MELAIVFLLAVIECKLIYTKELLEEIRDLLKE